MIMFIQKVLEICRQLSTVSQNAVDKVNLVTFVAIIVSIAILIAVVYVRKYLTQIHDHNELGGKNLSILCLSDFVRKLFMMNQIQKYKRVRTWSRLHNTVLFSTS